MIVNLTVSMDTDAHSLAEESMRDRVIESLEARRLHLVDYGYSITGEHGGLVRYAVDVEADPAGFASLIESHLFVELGDAMMRSVGVFTTQAEYVVKEAIIAISGDAKMTFAEAGGMYRLIFGGSVDELAHRHFLEIR